jgi:hypothetical protein
MSCGERDTYRIGVIGEYNQAELTASIDAYNGVKIASEELNANFQKYELVRIDMLDIDNIEELEKIIKDNDIDILIGPMTSSQYVDSAEYIHSVDIPVLLGTVSLDSLTNKDDNLFRLVDTVETQVKALGTLILDNKSSHVDIVYSSKNINYSEYFAKQLKIFMENNDVDSHLHEFGNLNNDSTIDMLRSLCDCKYYVVIAGPGEAGIVGQLLNEGSILYFSNWSHSDSTYTYLKNRQSDMYIVTFPEPIDPMIYKEYANNVYEMNGNLNTFTHFGYENMYFIDHIIGQIGSLGLDKVKTYIHNLDSYTGRFNIFEFNTFGDGGRSYEPFKIIDGVRVEIE